MPPPPIPCRPRARMSVIMSGATAHGGRAGDEDTDAREHHGAPPVDVAELTVERRDHSRCQQIGRHVHGSSSKSPKIAPDGRQRGGDDGLVERGEEHRQHEAEHDGADVAMAEHPASGLWARLRLGHFRFRHLGHVFRFCFPRLPRCSIQVTERVGPSGVQVPATAIIRRYAGLVYDQAEQLSVADANVPSPFHIAAGALG